jgi:hypothetical protein
MFPRRIYKRNRPGALGLDPEAVHAFTVGFVLAMSILGSLLMQYSSPLEAFATARLQS